MTIELHSSDYGALEKAAEVLGYSHTQLLKLSAHLITSAVLGGRNTIQTPITASRRTT
ncbi:hypothetical protein [Pandoraea iniqua]|nr:hypothetical protein [Pandoraea iniqua]